MRHAVVITQLMRHARSAADDEANERLVRTPRATVDAEPEPDPDPRPRRLATLARRVRARTLRLRVQASGREA